MVKYGKCVKSGQILGCLVPLINFRLNLGRRKIVSSNVHYKILLLMNKAAAVYTVIDQY